MKISILVHNLSNNCVSRAMAIASLLKSGHRVEIIGPKFGANVWEPVIGEVDVKVLSTSILDINSNLKKIDGDIIFAIKPRLLSFGYALIKKLLDRKKIILDIDDWEIGIVKESRQLTINSLLNDPDNLIIISLLDKLISFADQITVSSTFLQKKYGGTLFTNVRDTDLFNPNNYNKSGIKNKFGYSGKKIIMFVGTPRKHKGLELIIEALDIIRNPNILFIVVGDYTQFEFPEKDYLVKIPMKPINLIPEYLTLADLIILPQNNSDSAVGQVPTKLFDAMAMAKPIISTNVSDIPTILKNCGIIIPPEDERSLVKEINKVFENYSEAEKMGLRARKKCIREFSIKSNSKRLMRIIESF